MNEIEKNLKNSNFFQWNSEKDFLLECNICKGIIEEDKNYCKDCFKRYIMQKLLLNI